MREKVKEGRKETKLETMEGEVDNNDKQKKWKLDQTRRRLV